MNWLNKISIRKRLVFTLVTAIVTLAGFCFLSLMEMGELSGVIHNIYEDPLKISDAANTARIGILKMQREMRDVLLAKDKEEMLKRLERVDHLEQDIVKNLDMIRDQAVLKENRGHETKVRELFLRFRKNHGEMVSLLEEDRLGEALDISQNRNSHLVEQMEEILGKISENAEGRAWGYVKDAKGVERNAQKTLVVSMTLLGIFLAGSFYFIMSSILQPLGKLKAIMDYSTATDELSEVELHGNNEIIDMGRCYNLLVQKLRNQFWIKDSQNDLNQAISGRLQLKELTDKALSFLARKLGVGKGAIYLYDQEQRQLRLYSTFAFTERERLSNQYALGEGIVGQVALENKPILLTNIPGREDQILTGLIQQAPLNTYAFPLTHEGELYGVVELASFEAFTPLRQEFLRQSADIIAIALYGAIQNQRVEDLLAISEAAQQEAKLAAEELQKSNAILEEQQHLLQQTNAELEEQQQLLQQQSEELHHTNSQLEEQQQMLEEQSRLLNTKNQELEMSKEDLLRYSRQLETANRYKSEFLANMSHELRTPLNSIILLSRLLMRNKEEHLMEDDLEKVNVIHASGKELLRLINDILDLSKIEAGRMELNITEFHSSQLAMELEQLFENMAEEKQLQLKVEDTVNSVLYGDHDKISQILRNLLSNAIKFTAEGTVTLKIAKDPLASTGVLFSVTDTGIGIAHENLATIFQEFHQGDGSISRKYGGTGLGLSISKGLAELMDGEIKVESKVGQGSTFSLHLDDILLPVSQQGKLLENTSFLKECAVTKEEQSWGVDENKRILIIEDDEAFAVHVGEVSKAMGLDALLAKTGSEGLYYARHYPVEGILLDLMLPDMSGIEVLRELKSTVELRNIPVYIMSSKAKDNQPQKMGAIGYQEKPMEDWDIKDVLSRLLETATKKPRRILLIEDREEQKTAIEELVENRDIQTSSVDTREKAQALLAVNTYDVILLNLEIEQGTGIRVCRYLQEKGMETPVIVYTGKELTLEQEKEVRRYADHIIIKGANSQEGLMDEVTLFLHQVKKNVKKGGCTVHKTNKGSTLRLDGKKVLLVDDDPRNIFVLASTLEEYGAEILEAENGAVALEKLKETSVDLVLMDIMMPVMDGYETIQEIRENEALRNIPIIAVTAKTMKEDRDKCIEAGANDYISKPIDYDGLIRLIKAWIEK